MKHVNINFRSVLLAAVLAAPFLIYFSTARSLVTIWNSSETYAHGYIIVPVSLWLVWRKHQLLTVTPVQPYWNGVLLILLDGVLWLLSDLGDVQVLRQYSFVALIPLTVLTVAGPRVFAVIAFPLGYLLLAVPFGDIFIAPLINFTADFTVAALQLTGIPVLRDGSTFSIPSGNWSVVEACSGVRYLISSFTLGCLYAYLTYRQWSKRILLIIASLIIPVFANGLRAYMIVMLGHVSGMKLAVGVDHLIYGWLFFGLVMYALFWVGNHWKDSPADNGDSRAATVHASPAWGSAGQFVLVCSVVLFCLVLFPVGARIIERANYNPKQAQLNGLKSVWPEVSANFGWQPDYLPDHADLDRTYAKDNFNVRLNIRYYRNQTHRSQLISSSNKMVLDDNADWVRTSLSNRTEAIADSTTSQTRRLAIQETRLAGRSNKLLIWSLEWINGQFTNNHIVGKMMQTWNKLRLQGDDGAAIILCAPYADNPEQARAVLRSFLQAQFNAIEVVLNSNREQ